MFTPQGGHTRQFILSQASGQDDISAGLLLVEGDVVDAVLKGNAVDALEHATAEDHTRAWKE